MNEKSIDDTCMCMQAVFGAKAKDIGKSTARKIRAKTAYQSSHFKKIIEKMETRKGPEKDPNMQQSGLKVPEDEIILAEGLKDVIEVVRKSAPVEKKVPKPTDKIKAKIKSRRIPRKD